MEMENSSHADIAINTLDTNKTQQIKKYDINDAYKYLGITTAPNGNKKDTINVLKKYVQYLQTNFYMLQSQQMRHIYHWLQEFPQK